MAMHLVLICTADLSQYQHKFTIIGIAETNINEQNSGLYNINGYNLHYNSNYQESPREVAWYIFA